MINIIGIILPFLLKLANMYFDKKAQDKEDQKAIKASWDSFFAAYNKNVKSSADLSSDVDNQIKQLQNDQTH